MAGKNQKSSHPTPLGHHRMGAFHIGRGMGFIMIIHKFMGSSGNHHEITIFVHGIIHEITDDHLFWWSSLMDSDGLFVALPCLIYQRVSKLFFFGILTNILQLILLHCGVWFVCKNLGRLGWVVTVAPLVSSGFQWPVLHTASNNPSSTCRRRSKIPAGITCLHPGIRAMATPLLTLQSKTSKKPLLEQTWSNHDSRLHSLRWHLKSGCYQWIGKKSTGNPWFLVRHKYREGLEGSCRFSRHLPSTSPASSAQTQRQCSASSRSARAKLEPGLGSAMVKLPW